MVLEGGRVVAEEDIDSFTIQLLQAAPVRIVFAVAVRRGAKRAVPPRDQVGNIFISYLPQLEENQYPRVLVAKAVLLEATTKHVSDLGGVVGTL